MSEAGGYVTWLFDVEVYPNFALLGLRDRATGQTIQFSNAAGIGGTLDEARTFWKEQQAEALFVGFNSRSYDNVILHAIIVDLVDDPQKLFELSKRTITAERVCVEAVDSELSIDLLAINGGANARIGSLKEIGCKLDAARLQALPYRFDAELTYQQMVDVAAYNLNDLAVTALAENVSHEAVEARIALATEYGCGKVLNQHDAGVAEKLMAHQLFANAKPSWPQVTNWHIPGSALTKHFHYRQPELEALRDRISGWSLSYNLSSAVKADGTTEKEITGDSYADAAKIGETSYRLGSGGLHSMDEAAVYEADQQHRLIDFDVASFYPALVVNHEMAPAHLPRAQFIKAFCKLRDHRLAAKAAGRKSLADGLKISINSVFGKTKSAYSWLCDPTMTVSVTVLGQLTLLLFVDLVADIDGVQVVSANTDGLTLRLRRELADAVIAAMHTLAARLHLQLDQVEYRLIARRDISNYLAIELDGKVKAKGSYGFDQTALGKKAVHRVVIRAVQQYFVAGTPVADTIRACTDICEFIDFFKASKGYAIVDDQGGEYGGIARWYLSLTGVHLDKIKLADGKRTQLVERGARVVADLPDAMPPDVDFAAYIAMADALVQAITDPEIRVAHTIPLAELSGEQRAKQQINQTATEADPASCRQVLDLDRYHADYAANLRGNRYDSMKSLLVRAWLRGEGALTGADLLWLAQELDRAEGYFVGARRNTLAKMTGWIAREISPCRCHGHRPSRSVAPWHGRKNTSSQPKQNGRCGTAARRIAGIFLVKRCADMLRIGTNTSWHAVFALRPSSMITDKSRPVCSPFYKTLFNAPVVTGRYFSRGPNTMIDYTDHIDRVILAMSQDPLLYQTPDQLAAELIPNHQANERLMRALANGKGLISPRQLETSLARKLKAEIKADRAAAVAEAKAQHEEHILALLGKQVCTEREMIPAFLTTGGWTMSYGKEFTNRAGRTLTEDEILDEIQLAAAELRLTKKPLELKDRNFQRALSVYCRDERQARKEAVWEAIREPSNGRVAADVIAEFTRICGLYLRDAELGAAAIRKVIWSVKRKMNRLTVPFHHFVVLHGAQGSGKSTFWTFIKAAIQDFCKDVADVTDLLSNAQLDLFTYLLLEIPELGGIERADVAKLKSVITAPLVSRRVFHTQNMRDVFMAATFVGTTNFPIDTLFKDSSGMRRFVQIDVKEFDEISPHWHEIVGFDYAGLWQAVDHLGPDPLEPFADEVRDNQEGMRARDRVETWLDDFGLEPAPMGYLVATSSPPQTYQYQATTLFKVFKAYEAWAFCGAGGMTLTTWGLRMKALIDARMVSEWEYHTHGRRTIYTYRKTIVISLNAPDHRDASR